MSDLDLCKTRLEGIVEHTSSAEKLLIKVQEFMSTVCRRKQLTVWL
jgi:hypothetical protein